MAAELPRTDTLGPADVRWLMAEFKAVRDEIVLRADAHQAVHIEDRQRVVKWTGIASVAGATVGAAAAAFLGMFRG